MSTQKVLVIVAHTDDESFGCGGLIKSLSLRKNKIFAMSFTNGVGARKSQNLKQIKSRKNASDKAAKILGFEWVSRLDYPDNELDKISLLTITKKIEIIKDKIKPDLVITHNYSDLNIDHRKVFEAVITAFRPQAMMKAHSIITFEVPSSTDYRIRANKKNFTPNYYVNINKFINYKIKAIKCYKSEIKKSPNSRSLDGIKNLAKYRGNQVGMKYSEAYEIFRKIEK